jgi:ribulose-5-phosphate 4-epimerase/fuculose-1-phosphate aldolase
LKTGFHFRRRACAAGLEEAIVIKARLSRVFAIAAVCAWGAFGTRPADSQSANSLVPDVDVAILTELATSYQILVNEGVLDAYGHVSIRHPKNPNRYLMARSGEVAPAYVTASDIMEFDLDSNAIDLKGRVLHSERFIHGEIYKLRPDVNAVVHSHSRAVIPFSVTKVPLRAIFHNGAFLGDGVPVYEIRDESGDDNDMLVNTGAKGLALAKALGDRPVVLIRGHGDAVVGPTLQVAVFRAIYTEVNANLQIQATLLGGPITYLNQYEAQKSQRMERTWEAWKRQAAERNAARSAPRQ